MDGKSDPTWVTPFAMTNVQPGQHSITISKPGYVTDTRTVDVTGGNRATEAVHLTQLLATLIVKSEPAGASIYVDGKDVGAKTPAQVSVSKGQHVVLVRMSGYIDETMSRTVRVRADLQFLSDLAVTRQRRQHQDRGQDVEAFRRQGRSRVRLLSAFIRSPRVRRSRSTSTCWIRIHRST